MKTLELTTLWFEWLNTADKLTRVLHEQTVALTLRDVKRVEKIQPELDKFTVMMKEIDHKAAACATKLAEQLGVDAHVRSLVRVLEKTEGQKLQETANKVIVCARNLAHLQAKNRQLIENEMTYINGTLTLIAKVAVKDKPLRGRPVSTAVLVDQAA